MHALIKLLPRVGIAVLVLALLSLGAFVLWAQNPAMPMDEALSALQSDSQVVVELGEWYAFRPAHNAIERGVIIYPGGRVDPRAYAPLGRALAQQGYLVVIVPMPLNLAVFAPYKAETVIEAYPNIYHWVVGGHSLGGAMAARYALRHPHRVRGLFLWASYPAGSDDLSSLNLSVIAIYGDRDGLATPQKVLAAKERLPAHATFASIVGGNHAQFGWYGDQSGDKEATISREAQQEQILRYMVQFLKAMGWR